MVRFWSSSFWILFITYSYWICTVKEALPRFQFCFLFCFFFNSEKASHENKHLSKIWFLSYIRLKFCWCLYTNCRMNEPLIFFCDATIADKLFDNLVLFNPVSANSTKWPNTIKQFVSNSRQIVWVCLTILWGCRLQD